MGFVFGIKSGKFPFIISARHQSSEFLCFDDPLAMGPCHLNSIPTTVYCPDLRFLFRNPLEGLQLINGLFQTAAMSALTQFWGNGAFRRYFLCDEKPPASPEALVDFVMAGMNYPPSQYQLHLQFIHAPLLPFHFYQMLAAKHFHYGRFFPFEYLRSALALGDKARMDICEDTSIEEIITKLDHLGINYDSYHASLIRKCRMLQERFACWSEDDFAYHSTDGRIVVPATECAQAECVDPQVVSARDTRLLQNYGRPYGNDEKPTGVYYRYPKQPGEVKDFSTLSISAAKM
jgi:hypothetical protein